MIREQTLRARHRLVIKLPITGELLRGSLLERTVRHTKDCPKCARGEDHQVFVLTVTYPGHCTPGQNAHVLPGLHPAHGLRFELATKSAWFVGGQTSPPPQEGELSPFSVSQARGALQYQYQVIFEASLADISAGGQGNDWPSRCPRSRPARRDGEWALRLQATTDDRGFQPERPIVNRYVCRYGEPDFRTREKLPLQRTCRDQS
jgi:hypothetical protein